jgi:hypothetical protein
MKSTIALLRSLLDDFKRLNPGVKGLDRDLITIEKRFENEGFGFLAKALPMLDEALLLGLSSHQFTCPVGFKPVKGGTIPRFLSGMFCEVFDPFTGTLKEAPDFGVLKSLRLLLRFFKKTQVSAEDEDILHQKAVNEFYQCDERASRVLIPDRHDHLIGRVCKILLNSLNSKEVHHGKYKHGPGAVYEGYKANEKFAALWESIRSDDPLLHRLGLWGTGSDTLFSFDRLEETGPCEDSARSADLIRSVFPESLPRSKPGTSHSNIRESIRPTRRRSGGSPSFVDRASRGIARLISVPKNSSSRRTITVEPMLYQFVQQGLNILLRDSISECRILRNCLALSDQSKNQVLALEGSRFDNWATIDLKSASDLLSVSLVKSVFRHNPQFLEDMMACRSPFVESPNRETLTLGKFAGMGNALTFPVQSICFAVVCLAAIMDTEGTTPSYWRLRRASRHIRIYGDDIIVSKRYAHQCVAWLQDVGLAVNVKKSFLTGNFKESCGVEAFRGVDITPLYIKHQPEMLTSASPSIIAGFVSLSNTMWMEGLYEASTWLANEVEASLGRRLPLVSRDSGLLGWHSRQDAMTSHKWCRHTQQLLTKGLALSDVKRSDRLDGYAALYKWFLASQMLDDQKLSEYQEGGEEFQRSRNPRPMARDPDHLSRISMRYNNRIRSRWVPTLVRDGLNLSL